MLDVTQYDDDTMGRAYKVLMENGHSQASASDVVSGLQTAGILFRERVDEGIYYITTEAPGTKFDGDTPSVEAPKEWIERQEAEQRAWAVNSAIELFRHASSWDVEALIPTAKQIVEFVKGPEKEDPDLHDQDAFDTWGVVMYEQLFGERIEIVTEEDIQREASRHELLDKLSDALTKQGVRFKNGERFERLDEV